MGTQAHVSVVVPTFNRAHYLAECLDSVLSQTLPPTQVIVVDDGSDDDTAAVVGRYGDRLTYLRKPNGGKPSALNLGLPHARGEFVWLFDDDDVALPDSIERRVEALQSDPQLGYVATGHYIGTDGPDGKITRQREHVIPVSAPGREFLDLLYGCFFTMQSMLIRRDCLMGAGPFDETLFASEDYDMMLRMARTHPFRILAEPSFIFRQHQGARGATNVRYQASDRQKVFMKYDGAAGLKLRSSLDLSDFLVPRRSPPVTEFAERRMALLTRMSVMASKGLVKEMSEDASAAASISPGNSAAPPLSDSERALCRTSTCQLYFWMRISEAPGPLMDALAPLKRFPVGRSILRELSAGLLRFAKSYGFPMRDRARMLWLAGRLAMRA